MQIICTSLQTDNHVSTSSLHIFTGWMLFLTPAYSVKALKAKLSSWACEKQIVPHFAKSRFAEFSFAKSHFAESLTLTLTLFPSVKWDLVKLDLAKLDSAKWGLAKRKDTEKHLLSCDKYLLNALV